MMNKVVKLVLATALACCGLAFNAQADSISAQGGVVAYAGAAEAKTLADGDVVLVFTNTQDVGSFTLPKNAKARVLAVGGGGAGGSLAAVDELGKGSAGGGGAGGVSDRETILNPGEYTVKVGVGGARVQTIVQSWVGANGGNTMLALNGQTLAIGKGGGGGGSVKVNGRGEAGGSGGGGSWYGDFTQAGTAVDGQGWAGGKPASTDCGGGGGGAAKDAADGTGKADGTAGAGRALDITGETVVYGQGGAGGQRAAVDAAAADGAAADGAGFGFGGAGANVTGRGGAGGDGVLVVRIHKLFDYTKVDYPQIPSFEWKEGESYVAFDAATVVDPLKSAIDYVEGVTATNAAVVTVDGQTVTNGLGRFCYAIHLKDEYVWNDGTAEGSTKPFVAYWRVKAPGTVSEATIEVTKTVDWSEGANATLAFDVHSTPEKRRTTPNVLVIGTLCGAHGLSSKSVNTMLNTVSEVANLDWYFWNHVTNKNDKPYFTGHMNKGAPARTETIYGLRQNGLNTANPTTSRQKLEDVWSNHGVVYGFYKTIAELLDSGKAADYDYILFSFDRSLAATYFRWPHPDEASVAQYLKSFYASGSVIWFIDHDGASVETRPGLSVTPWYPNILCYRGDDRTRYGWMSIGYYEKVLGQYTDETRPYGYQPYRALMGLFDPAKYDEITQARYTEVLGADGASGGNREGTAKQVRALAGDVNPNQTDYDNPAAIAELIRNVVKAKIATLHVEDHVHLSDGLKINQTTGYWTTNEAYAADNFETAKGRWEKLTPEQLTVSDTEGIQVNIPGVKTEAWLKFNVGVTDTGTFRSSLNAKYNEKTGFWEKDPNNGPVVASLQSLGGENILAQDTASTAVAWSFPTYKITGTVVHGEGEIVLNGFITNTLDVAEGCTPEVVFRGKGGYVLDYLVVDGQVIDDFDKDLYNWIFNEVGADHDVKVGFKTVFTVPYPTTDPAVREYDGQPAQPTVTPPTFIPGYDYEWKAMYSMESNGVYTVDCGETNVVRDAAGNVISTNVYVRIWINQPGYEDGVVIDYWTGCDTATVRPRPITVKYDDYVQTSSTQKTDDFSSAIVSGTLVAGDTLVPNGGTCTNYPTQKGGMTEDSITAKGDVVITTPDFDGNNYVITVLPGDYYYPDLDLVANAPSVTKVYDGVAIGTVATVVFPADAATREPKDQPAEKGGPQTWDMDYLYNHTPDGRKGTTGLFVKTKYIQFEEGGPKYYGVSSNETTTIQRTVSTSLEKTYSVGGVDYAEPPAFTNVGVYTVHYEVTYVSNVVTTTTTEITVTGRRDRYGTDEPLISGSREGDPTLTNKIEYTSYAGTATITILPRPVTVTAGSAEKEYNGEALTQPDYTVSEKTDTTGFITGEGIFTAPMTEDSTLTNPGVKSNKIDQDKVTFTEKTDSRNYTISYVDGQLKVTQNALQATAPKIEKVYDGTPTDQVVVTVVDSHDKPLPAGSYTITYKMGLNGTPSTTVPQPPTDAGEYPVFYTVDGGAGYGVVSGVTTIKVTPRTVTLKANDAKKPFDGKPLTETGFKDVSGGTGEAVGFVGNEGIAAVTMTEESQQTEEGSTPNVIDVYDTENWTMNPGTKVQNYVFKVLPGTLTVWMQGAALWIIDHEDPGDGWVYLAFEPELKVEEELKNWVERSAANNMIRVKYGQTREAADACKPVIAQLSDKPGHAITTGKVWIKVSLNDLNQVTVVKPVGYWRIFIDCPAIELSGTGGGSDPGLQTTPDPGLQDTTPEIIGDGAVSVNTFGILKIERATTNTMIAVPWTWYSKLQDDAENIPVKKLVKTTNLEEGDYLYAPLNNDTYAAWMVEYEQVTDAGGNVYTNSKWSAVQVVRVDKDGFGRMQFQKDNDDDNDETYMNSTRIARGNGLWLHRQKPLDDAGNIRPFWVYGQSVTNEVTTVIPGPSGTETVRSTMIGNPYARDLVLNEINFGGTIDSGDRIKIHTLEGANHDLVYVKNKGWREYTTTIVNGVQKSGFTYKTVIPAGMAFWYDRRGKTPLQITWPKPQESVK